MSEFKGFVKKINVKTGNGKRGAWSAYSCKIEKEDGTEYPEWLSLGFNPPLFKEGDYIKCEAAKDDKGYMAVNKDSIKVAKNPPARAGKTGGGSSEPSNDSSHGNYAKGGVTWGAAVARAIELTKLLADLDALPISGGKGASHTAKRNAEVVAVVDKLSVKLYNDSMTLRLLETVADTQADTKADGELPPKEDAPEAEDTTEDEDDNF